MTAPRRPDAGLTLVEVLVALVIFALIGTTGFGMLDQVLRVQDRTEGRLDRLAAVQRTLYLVTADFAAALPGSVAMPESDAGSLGLRRAAPDDGSGAVALRYAAVEGGLVRTVSDTSGTLQARQRLLAGISGAAWRLYDPEQGWISAWPPPGSPPTRRPRNPAAVELRLTLADGSTLRRVALLPGEPR